MKDEPTIIVGSTSEHKLAAVHAACRSLGLSAVVHGTPAASGVNEQPFGFGEIVRGARARANEAWTNTPHVDIAIGIENGVMAGDFLHYVDIAAIVVYDGERYTLAMSPAHEISFRDYLEALRRGFDKHTVGEVTAERTGCDKTDPTSYYTSGVITRADALKQGVRMALAQWMRGTAPETADPMIAEHERNIV